MIVFSEEKHGAQSTYRKIILDDDGNELVSKAVVVTTRSCTLDDFEYLVLYDTKMNVIHDAYTYLNVSLQNYPINSRSSAANALKILYSFIELTNYDLRKLSIDNFASLLNFIKGSSLLPERYSFKTQRNNKTTNHYLAIYRKFFKACGCECAPLFETTLFTKRKASSEEKSSQTIKYSNNLKTISSDEVPKYISPEEFRILYTIVLEKQDNTAAILLHLMYGYGLRLGECLGLTIEDVTEFKENGVLYPVLFIRNRITDKDFQCAKRLLHVKTERQYHTHDYTLSRNKIVITRDFYAEILNYINETHTRAFNQHYDNYQTTVADTVSYNSDLEDDNHYIFLNRYGRVLSDQAWNKKLRSYFEEAGIALDMDVRQNNLSHRFRHGFAMFHAHFSEHPVKDILALAKLMRHRCITSCNCYFNPTLEDKAKLQEKFKDDLYSLIPELRL